MIRRISVSILGTEILAIQIGTDPTPDQESPTVRYDPTSTTALTTETSYQGRLGFHIDANPSVDPL